jgi:DNA-binding CsgD family transcriptional regulator
MERLSIQSLNAIFSCFDQHPTAILWIRNKDYQKQVYVGANFERIWKRSVDLIYDAPHAWNEFLYKDDENTVIQEITNRIILPEQTGSRLLYRIVDAEGGIQFIIDEVFMLEDNEKQHVGYMGYSLILTEREWHDIAAAQKITQSNTQAKQLREDVIATIYKELQINASPLTTNEREKFLLTEPKINLDKIRLRHLGKDLPVTARETEVIGCLVAGKTAKETAIALKISPRTVNFHLENLRLKTNSRSKMELLGKLVINE